MTLNQLCVDTAIHELEQIVCAGMPSAGYVPGAAVERSNNSYFVATPTALISLKSVARLAYIKCRMTWDRPSSKRIADDLMLNFGVVVMHDTALEEGLRNLNESKATQPRWKYAQTKARLDQARFRGVMLQEFDGKCALSGCDEQVVLEACHVIPFAEEGVDEAQNGLLLRADLHRLFDDLLISVNPTTRSWVFAERARAHYADLHGRTMSRDVFDERAKALREHWEASDLGG